MQPLVWPDDTIPLTDITEAAPELQAVYIVPYDIWNLNFFQPVFPDFCLSSNINTVQLMSLGYITTFYPLLLVFTFFGIMITTSSLFVDQSTSAYITFTDSGICKTPSSMLLERFYSYTKFTLVSALMTKLYPKNSRLVAS